MESIALAIYYKRIAKLIHDYLHEPFVCDPCTNLSVEYLDRLLTGFVEKVQHIFEQSIHMILSRYRTKDLTLTVPVLEIPHTPVEALEHRLVWIESACPHVFPIPEPVCGACTMMKPCGQCFPID